MDRNSLTRTSRGVCHLACRYIPVPSVPQDKIDEPYTLKIDDTRWFPSFWNTAFTIQPSASFLASSKSNLIVLKRWLLEVGRDEEARKVVYKLHGSDRSSAEKEFTQMYDAIKAELSVGRRRLSDLWATRAMLRRTLVAAGVQIFTQFTGINGTCVITPVF
jgi:hypothetical protein